MDSTDQKEYSYSTLQSNNNNDSYETLKSENKDKISQNEAKSYETYSSERGQSYSQTRENQKYEESEIDEKSNEKYQKESKIETEKNYSSSSYSKSESYDKSKSTKEYSKSLSEYSKYEEEEDYSDYENDKEYSKSQSDKEDSTSQSSNKYSESETKQEEPEVVKERQVSFSRSVISAKSIMNYKKAFKTHLSSSINKPEKKAPNKKSAKMFIDQSFLDTETNEPQEQSTETNDTYIPTAALNYKYLSDPFCSDADVAKKLNDSYRPIKYFEDISRTHDHETFIPTMEVNQIPIKQDNMKEDDDAVVEKENLAPKGNKYLDMTTLTTIDSEVFARKKQPKVVSRGVVPSGLMQQSRFFDSQVIPPEPEPKPKSESKHHKHKHHHSSKHSSRHTTATSKEYVTYRDPTVAKDNTKSKELSTKQEHTNTLSTDTNFTLKTASAKELSPSKEQAASKYRVKTNDATTTHDSHSSYRIMSAESNNGSLVAKNGDKSCESISVKGVTETTLEDLTSLRTRNFPTNSIDKVNDLKFEFSNSEIETVTSLRSSSKKKKSQLSSLKTKSLNKSEEKE